MKMLRICFQIAFALSALLGFAVGAVAQYVHLSGSEVQKLIVGHTIGMPFSPTVFTKDGHLGSPYGHASKSTYQILADGQVCLGGGASITSHYRAGGGGTIGNCFKIVKSGPNYLAVKPDDNYDLFILNFRD